jgi:cytochrome c6
VSASLRYGLPLCALLIASSAPAFAQSPAEEGALVFDENCSSCHGEEMRAPDGAFDLRTLKKDERPRFDKIVAEGKGQMPVWKGVLTDEQLDQVWAYIRAHAQDR